MLTIEAIQEFAENAAAHIATVAAEIKKDAEAIASEDFGLLSVKLKQKFENMRCTQTYIDDFNKSSGFFPTIQVMIENDTFGSHGETIRHIMSYVVKIYIQLSDNFVTGDKIHTAALSQISKQLSDQNHKIAANILICFTIHECGIFNDKK